MPDPILILLRLARLRLPLLLAFVAATAFPMAGLRAWVFIGLGAFSNNHNLHLTSHQRLLISVVFCLSLSPEQFFSIGLPLSWMACLGLIVGRQAFSQSALVYLFTFPIIATIQWLSPWTIAINTFLAPWVGALLFPISFLTVCIPWLQPLADGLWSLFTIIAQSLAKPFQASPSVPMAGWHSYSMAVLLGHAYFSTVFHSKEAPMKWALGVFVVFLNPNLIGCEWPFNFVVWNVGQGAWSTWVQNGQCLHFDMGGEKFPWPEILRHCKHKKNQVYVTHDDWDHVNGLFFFQKHVTDICVFYPKSSRRKIFKQVAKCKTVHPDIQVISHGSDSKDRNASSLIYLFRNQVLITGDAPKSEENKWYWKLPTRLRLLLLGHHGSLTSTSDRLLTHSRPQLAIASARKTRYGHPHPKVIRSLKKQRIPMLRTEILGSIYLKLK